MAEFPNDIVFATRMNGRLLTRIENASNGYPARNNLYSEEMQWVPQYVLEDVLRAHAVSLAGVAIEFDTELSGFTQTDEAVTARLLHLPSGVARDVRAKYLIGADGARSVVRDGIGARYHGEQTPLMNTNIVFRSAAIGRAHTLPGGVMYWMLNDDVSSILGPMDRDGMWYFIATKLPPGLDPATADWAALIRKSTGLPDIDVEVLRADPWIARTLVADSYSRGRAFLAGDSCHLHPPFGGFGMNMGIGDAVDLGWKMAATLQGWGGPGLLASYEQERRGVHVRTIAEARTHYHFIGGQLVQPMLEDDGPLGEAARAEAADVIQATKLGEFKTLGVVLGMRYADSPIVVPDGTTPPAEHAMIYLPSACPGCLAPHLWLADRDGGGLSSLYDHFGPDFSLLVTEGDGAEAAGFVAAGRGRVRLVAPGDARLRARYAGRYALIRPDQHVAWRGDALPEDARGLLDAVMAWTSPPKKPGENA